MKTNKDKLFIIILISWFIINLIGYYIDGEIGITVANIICIMIFGTMVIIQYQFLEFRKWLEKPLKR